MGGTPNWSGFIAGQISGFDTHQSSTTGTALAMSKRLFFKFQTVKQKMPAEKIFPAGTFRKGRRPFRNSRNRTSKNNLDGREIAPKKREATKTGQQQSTFLAIPHYIYCHKFKPADSCRLGHWRDLTNPAPLVAYEQIAGGRGETHGAERQ